MSLDKNDKLSLGVFGVGAVLAYVLAVAANKKSGALAEEGGSEPPIVPKGWRVIRIQKKVSDLPGGVAEYTEQLKYLLPEGPATPTKIKQLQKALGHPNPSGYIDAWTRENFGKIYTTWEIRGGPRSGQTAEGPSLLDMIRPSVKGPGYKGAFDPRAGRGGMGAVGIGIPATYQGLGERTAGRSGKGRQLPVPQGMKAPLMTEEEAATYELRLVLDSEGNPVLDPQTGLPMTTRELRVGAAASRQQVDDDIDQLVLLASRGKVYVPAVGSPEMTPAERAAARRESTFGFFASLPAEEQRRMVELGLFDPKTGVPTDKAVLESETRNNVPPVVSSVSSVRRAAIAELQKEFGLKPTGEAPPPSTFNEMIDRIRMEAGMRPMRLNQSPSESVEEVIKELGSKGIAVSKKGSPILNIRRALGMPDAELTPEQLLGIEIARARTTGARPVSVQRSKAERPTKGWFRPVVSQPQFRAPASAPRATGVKPQEAISKGSVVTHPEFGRGVVTGFRESGAYVVVDFPGISSFTASTGGGTRTVPYGTLLKAKKK